MTFLAKVEISNIYKIFPRADTLTVNPELYPLADGWGHPVPGDAHVGPHVHPGDLPQLEDGSGHLLG